MRKKPRGHQLKGKLIIGRCQSPLLLPAECGCAITEPDYRHPPADVASQSGKKLDQGMVGPVKLFEFSAEEAISKTLVK